MKLHFDRKGFTRLNFSAKNLGGFTLIEMLIVIAIIGILASIVLVGLGPVQRSARDSRRASDLRSVQNALELCYSKGGSYPVAANWAELITALTGIGGSPQCGGSAVVPRIPSDPLPAQTYEYSVNCAAGTSYMLKATLEDPTSNLLANPAEPDAAPTCGLDCTDAAPNTGYCVEF